MHGPHAKRRKNLRFEFQRGRQVRPIACIDFRPPGEHIRFTQLTLFCESGQARHEIEIERGQCRTRCTDASLETLPSLEIRSRNKLSPEAGQRKREIAAFEVDNG